MEESLEPEFNYRELLDYHRKKNMSFSDFVERFIENPEDCLKTSSTLAILVDEQAMERYAQTAGFDLSSLQRRFHRFTVFAAYVAKHFLANNAEFVQRFNQNIYQCY